MDFQIIMTILEMSPNLNIIPIIVSPFLKSDRYLQ